jgi:hypothetical protein
MAEFGVIWLAVLAFGPLSFAETRQYRTKVAPKQGETLAGPCAYQITLPQSNRPVRGVLVIFDRGEQVRDLVSDAAVVRFAAQSDLGFLLAQHCPAKRIKDIDVVPANGIGRALITALDQFGSVSNHPELSRSAMIYFGMSGTGSLAARMVDFIPERTIGSVEYVPDQEDPVGIDTVTISDKALAVPQFIIANGGDKDVGTARPYAYFEQYRKRGAPLTFLIQNRTPHCCVANIVPVMLAWLADVVRLRVRSVGEGLLPIDQTPGWFGTLQVGESGVKEEDPSLKVWNAVGAKISPSRENMSSGLDIPRSPDDKQVPSSATLLPVWLPSREFAQTWLAFAQMEKHPFVPRR